MRIAAKNADILKKLNQYVGSFPVQGICLLLYKILVDLIYLFYTAPTFGYFEVRINGLNIASSYLYIGMYTIFFYKFVKSQTVSSIMFIVMSMTYLVPITTYCSIGSGSSNSSFLLFALLYWTFFSVLQIMTPVFSLRIPVMDSRWRSFFMYFLLAGISIFTVYLSWKYTGFRIATSLRDVYVYGIRAEAAAYSMSTASQYLQSFSTVLIPLLILFCFRQKKYVLVLWGTFLLYLNFSYAVQKSVLFMGILVLAGAVFWREWMASWILPGGIGLAILAMIEKRFFSHVYIVDYFFRRMGYVLAQLSEKYYCYFRNNPTDIFRGTFLGKLGFESPYRLSLSYVIGNNYRSQTMACNNGMLADVWANLGMIGILVMPFILIVCFRLFDLATDGLLGRYVIGMAVYATILFLNSTWSTVLLTHGFLIMCMVYFIFPREKG